MNKMSSSIENSEMGSEKNNQMAVTTEEKVKDIEMIVNVYGPATAFESSMKPLILLLNSFGLYIPTGKIQPKSFSYGGCVWILFLIGTFFLLADFAYYIYASMVAVEMMNFNNLGYDKIGNQTTNLTSANLFSRGLAWFNIAGYTTLIHLSFFIGIWLTPGNWKHLWMNLQEIAHQMNLKPDFYHRMKKIVRFALLLLLLDSGIFSYISQAPAWFWPSQHSTNSHYPIAGLISSNPSLIVPFIEQLYSVFVFMLNLTNLIVRLILSLLFVLVFFAADLFVALNQRAKDIVLQHDMDSDGSLLTSELEKWKKSHRLVCRLVRQINRCFSVIILLTISNGYLSFITNIFIATSDLLDLNSEFDSIIYIVIFGRELIFLSTFIYASNRVKAEVSRPIAYIT